MLKKTPVLLLIFCLFVPVALAASATNGSVLKSGARSFTQAVGNGKVEIHTFLAPGEAAANATHIIELEDRLVLIDMQAMQSYAEEFRKYADALGKPIDRIFLSHEHPDHWIGAIAFQGAAVHALPETAAYIEENGEKILKAKARPGKVPVFAGHVKTGSETIGGVRFVFSRVKDAESEFALMIDIPELKVLVLQDLLYNGIHFYLGHDSMNRWSEQLMDIKSQYDDYNYFLCGHGEPVVTAAGIDPALAYLEVAKEAFRTYGRNSKKIKAMLLERFPDHSAEFLLDIGLKKAIKK